MSPTTDSVVVITGASSGIGAATAVALAARSTSLVLAARRLDRLEKVAAQVEKAGGHAVTVKVDVTDDEDVRHLVDVTLERFGRIDTLVVNAGIWHQQRVEDLSIELVEDVLAVDYVGAVRTVLASLRALRSGSQIIFVNSLDGKKGVPHEGAYAAAKHALAGFAGVARQELKERGIAVTTVYPGRVDTPMIEDLTVPAVQPKLPPERVARAIASAARRPRAEVYVPAITGRLYAWAGTLAPVLTDRLTRLLRLEGRQ